MWEPKKRTVSELWAAAWSAAAKASRQLRTRGVAGRQAVIRVSRQQLRRLRGRKIPWAPVAVVLVLMLGGMVALARAMPDDEAYALAAGAMTTMIYDHEGELITELYWENRIPVELDQVPEHTLQAFMAVEDVRFYRHRGIDVAAVLRASIHNLTNRNNINNIQGGSTITQQLARNAFEDIGYERTMERKIREALVAVSLERRYSKDEIFQAYLNQIYLGQGAYGLGAASRVYFGKEVSELTVAESALLAGLPVAPSHYTPFVNPEGALSRQRLALERMVNHGWLDQDEASAVREIPLEQLLLETPQMNQDEHPYPWFVDEVMQRLVQDFTDHYAAQGMRQEEARGRAETVVFTGGLHVHTTLDVQAQEALEAAAAAVLDPLDPLPDPDDPNASAPLQIGGIFMEPETGYVRALVGGREHPGLWAFNRATQGQRQPGSAFKPIIAYGAALAAGRTPATVVDDSPFVRGDWAPRNVDHRYLGLTTYREALRRSVNVAAVRVVAELGIDTVVDYAQRLGIESLVTEMNAQGQSDLNLATALGGLTRGVTPLELTRAYGVFANQGIQVEPTFITRVSGPDGAVLLEQEPLAQEVIPAAEAYIMTDMLRSAVRPASGAWNRDGFTGWRAVEGPVMSRWDVAGKTGTADGPTDIWFVGYTRKMVGTVWMGYDLSGGAEPQPVRLRGVNGFGGLWPTMVWNQTMTAVHREQAPLAFQRPDGVVEATICIKSGLLPESECGSGFQRRELFVEGSEPEETGNAFSPVTVYRIDSRQLARMSGLLARDPFLGARPYLLADDSCPSRRTENRLFLNRSTPDLELVRRFRELAYDGAGSLRQYLPADLVLAAPLLSCSDARELLEEQEEAPKDLPAVVGPTAGDEVAYGLHIYPELLGPEQIRLYPNQRLNLSVRNHRTDDVRVTDSGGTTVFTVAAGSTVSWSASWEHEGSVDFAVQGQGTPLEFTIQVVAEPAEEDPAEEEAPDEEAPDEEAPDEEAPDDDA